MRCYICDNELSTTEIQLGEDGRTEPCSTCMRIVMDTAYCDGFEPYTSEDEVDPSLDEEEMAEN